MADQGFTRSKLIAMADARTEQRGKVLDKDAEFLIALQEFCLEQRWWWRKKSVTFNTVAGTATYDLGDAIAAIDCEQIVKGGVKLFTSGTTYVELTPVYDSDEQDVACEDTTTDQPSQYFIERGSSQTLRLSPVPGGVYKIRVTYWAIPNVQSDSQDDQIPLVPGYLHHIVQKKLEAQIFRFTLGEGSTKYQAAQGEYMAAVAKASEKRDFEDGRVREWVNTDCEDSVRSTH